MVPCKDGVRLATEVFLPNGLELGQKVPSIVIRTCYGKARDIDRSWHWVTRGYAFVIQDVRGRSDSDGTLEAFQHEREDADDLFNWIAAQPWSDGNIGMWGASYLGYTTTSACTSGNPHLQTAVSEVNVGSPFYDTVRKGGTVCSWPLLCWTLAQSVSNRVDMTYSRAFPSIRSRLSGSGLLLRSRRKSSAAVLPAGTCGRSTIITMISGGTVTIQPTRTISGSPC